jgi:hypothetical protein
VSPVRRSMAPKPISQFQNTRLCTQGGYKYFPCTIVYLFQTTVSYSGTSNSSSLRQHHGPNNASDCSRRYMQSTLSLAGDSIIFGDSPMRTLIAVNGSIMWRHARVNALCQSGQYLLEIFRIEIQYHQLHDTANSSPR